MKKRALILIALIQVSPWVPAYGGWSIGGHSIGGWLGKTTGLKRPFDEITGKAGAKRTAIARAELSQARTELAQEQAVLKVEQSNLAQQRQQLAQLKAKYQQFKVKMKGQAATLRYQADSAKKHLDSTWDQNQRLAKSQEELSQLNRNIVNSIDQMIHTNKSNESESFLAPEGAVTLKLWLSILGIDNKNSNVNEELMEEVRPVFDLVDQTETSYFSLYRTSMEQVDALAGSSFFKEQASLDKKLRSMIKVSGALIASESVNLTKLQRLSHQLDSEVTK